MYAADSYYHVYNRGVEKRTVFEDNLDYRVFLSYFKIALSPEEDEDVVTAEKPAISNKLRRLHLEKEVELLAFCLLPNHFHLMLYQYSQRGIQKLMQSVMTGYVMYFNKRYDRVGSLFQGRYKAANIDNEAYLLHISRYIHLNTIDAGSQPEGYEYSSYPYYMGKKHAEWIKPEKILQLHNNRRQDYASFVNDYTDRKQDLDEIKPYLANL